MKGNGKEWKGVERKRPNPQKPLIIASGELRKNAETKDGHLVEALAIVALLNHAKSKGRVLVEPVHNFVVPQLPGSAIVVFSRLRFALPRKMLLLALQHPCSP